MFFGLCGPILSSVIVVFHGTVGSEDAKDGRLLFVLVMAVKSHSDDLLEKVSFSTGY